MKEVEFLQFVVENLVENKDLVKIERKEDELGVLLTLSVDKSDMGVIIGKSGSTINSLRNILRIIGVKIGKRVNLKVLD